MKTTLDIDDRLLARAKTVAARLIEEGLRLRLRRRRGSSAGVPPRVAVYAGRGGLVPGIDPRSNRSLNDAADDA